MTDPLHQQVLDEARQWLEEACDWSPWFLDQVSESSETDEREAQLLRWHRNPEATFRKGRPHG